jgi:hypothetical protein
MLRQCLNEAKVKYLLWLGKRFLGVERPNLLSVTASGFGFEYCQNCDNNNDNDQQQNNCAHFSCFPLWVNA